MLIPASVNAPLAELVSAGFLALVTYLVRLLAKRIDSHLGTEAMAALQAIVRLSVVKAEHTVVADLKDPNKPGTWNAVEEKRVRDAVLEEIESIGKPLIERLIATKHIDEHAVEELLEAAIESCVAELSKG